MKFDIPYLGKTIPLELPDDCKVEVLEPNDVSIGDAGSRGHGNDAVSMVREAVDNPSCARPFSSFLGDSGNVLVIVNDGTRPTPTAAVLDAIADDLDRPGLRFIVATGAHRGPTESEYHQILGRHYDRFRTRCFAHDARDESILVDLGKTRNGTPILLNRAVFEADRVVAIGSVEPHYFAGYTGGRKAFLPGVAGFRTIETNHKLALSDMARACELEHNPVSQDMDDALNLIVVPTFAIMTVLDKDQGLAFCSAGDIRLSFIEAVAKADSIFSVALDARADVVVSVARFPMDIDLYQSQKAIDNGSLALKDGGTLIMVSSCRDGIGDRAFLELMGSASSPADAIERIRGGFRLGYHKAAKIALVAARASIVAVSELDPDLLAKAFIRSESSLQKAFDEALAKAGPGASVAILPDGTVTVPKIGAR